MKKIIILIIGILAFFGCNDNFLEEIPQDFISTKNYFRNGDDAVAAVNSVYRAFINGEEHRYYVIVDLMAEAVTTKNQTTGSGNGLGDYDNNRLQFNTGNPGVQWQLYYDVINRANWILKYVGEMDESKFKDLSIQDRVLGEAYFLRALSYFTLVRFFGGVPLRLEAVESISDAESKPRNTDAEVYDQVIADLEKAISLLPQNSTYSDDNIGRASKGAAKTLLGKVYLQRGSLCENNGISGDRLIAQSNDFQKAADYCQEVIDDGEYHLVKCAELFGFDKIENNSEIIYTIQHSPGVSYMNYLAYYLNLPNSDLLGGSYGSLQSSLDFYKSFSANDNRKSVTFYTQYVLNGNTVTYNMNDPHNDNYSHDTPAISKYYVRAANDDSDEILLRYADVLLMKAEALNEVNNGPTAEAYDAINQVRNRAGLDDLTGLTYTQFKDSVYIERQKEFVMEGQAWFDGQRYFSFYKEMQKKWSGYKSTGYYFGPWETVNLEDPKDRLLPITQSIIDDDPLIEQNPGY